MDEFSFDAATHTYRLGSRRLPGTTDICKSAGLCPEYGGDDYYRDRGSFIHQACALWLMDNLDESSLDPAIKPFVESFMRWVERTKYQARRVEHADYHPILFYAGTWDTDDGECLIDLKSGVKERWHKIQTALYRGIAIVRGVDIKRRGSLYLQGDASIAKFDPHPNHREDWAVAQSALNIHNWKEAA